MRRVAEPPRWLAPASWSAAVAAALLTVVALVLYARNSAALGRPDRLYLADVWLGLVLPVLGALVLRRGRRLLLGLVLMSGALIALTDAAGQVATYEVLVRGQEGIVSRVAAWLSAWTWTPYLLVPTLVVLLFPDGRVPRGWRPVAWCVVGVVGAATVAWALAPVENPGFPGLTNPWAITGAAWLAGAAGLLTAGTMLVLAPACLLSVVRRAQRSTGPARSRLLWFLAAAVVALASLVAADGLPYPWPDLLAAGGLTLVLLVVVLTSQSLAAAEEVARAREQLVRARETERWRLHRDLHDGVGPELAGLALDVAAAARTAPDASTARRLAETHERLRGLAGELRRVVDGLRPPALDELGLAEAVREQLASRAGHDAGVVPAVEFRTTGALTALPPAVEVAAYRIIAEAWTNVLRHSGAGHCTVRLDHSEAGVDLEVCDDGRWVDPSPARRGAGRRSMTARAEELGGWCRITPGPSGTVVRAHLPLEPA